jgi:hypothetical protein
MSSKDYLSRSSWDMRSTALWCVSAAACDITSMHAQTNTATFHGTPTASIHCTDFNKKRVVIVKATCRRNLSGPHVTASRIQSVPELSLISELHEDQISHAQIIPCFCFTFRRWAPPGFFTEGGDTQNHNLTRDSLWVWNLVSDIKEGTQTEGVWEQGAEENIWGEERRSDRRLEKTT